MGKGLADNGFFPFRHLNIYHMTGLYTIKVYPIPHSSIQASSSTVFHVRFCLMAYSLCFIGFIILLLLFNPSFTIGDIHSIWALDIMTVCSNLIHLKIIFEIYHFPPGI